MVQNLCVGKQTIPPCPLAAAAKGTTGTLYDFWRTLDEEEEEDVENCFVTVMGAWQLPVIGSGRLLVVLKSSAAKGTDCCCGSSLAANKRTALRLSRKRSCKRWYLLFLDCSCTLFQMLWIRLRLIVIVLLVGIDIAAAADDGSDDDAMMDDGGIVVVVVVVVMDCRGSGMSFTMNAVSLCNAV
jgi:hypothetical protein